MRNYGSRLIALLAVTLSSSACAPAISNCPPWPPAGPEVAEELARLPGENYPATWEWLGRLERLQRQIEACRSSVVTDL